ncbi:Sbal_3080 family lipoprotein [Vibrio sp. Isolate33]|uniref:Sbal_3080 family lipoprotein n=1 Tax=Vibrio sp. Isolate33 TaxID=2908539 RepID=UPI001EFC520E|nr:Sbal_3080 family lipoprotein [Vibrio sp. Isolate33]MCG9543328.1 Sbal_3080 family lipoprotein [Vibrio sp. Isolate33]
MKNWLVAAVVVLLAGCSAPKYSGNALPEANKIEQVTIVEDEKTRAVFLDSMLDWCLNNQVKCKVVADGSEHNPEEITLDYVSRWSWDFRTFVADAKISAYQDQQRVGNVDFKAPNSGNFSKFGDDMERIKAMMDILFDKKTAAQATQMIAEDQL